MPSVAGNPFKSRELEMGKCGEYYAIFSLMKQGFTAFLSDQGLPYDIVVDVNGRLLKGQVKTTWARGNYTKSREVYRFGTRSGKRGQTRTVQLTCDFYAFVALADEKIAFMASSEMASKKIAGAVKQLFEFRTADIVYPGRAYSNGTVRQLDWHRNIEFYQDFNRTLEKLSV